MEENKKEKKTTTSKRLTNTKNNSNSINRSKNSTNTNIKSTKNKVNTNSKENEDIELLDKTNSFDIIIDDERLKDKESLDFSFIDGKRKKKKAHADIEILEDKFDYKEESKKLDMPKKAEKSSDFLSTVLIILFSFILGFLICFIWARESAHFTKTEKVIEEVVEKQYIVDDNYVFLGDSIFEGYDLEEFYENMPVVNSGVSGNKTIDILNNMNDRVYRYNPSKVILMIGTNDYSSISNEDTVKNIGKIIDAIKENRPYAEIYVQSIYPVNKNVNDGVSVKDRNNEDINTMNIGIEKLCKEKKVTYMNIYELLVDDEGNLKENYTSDGLHLNADAYAVITKEVKKVLKN